MLRFQFCTLSAEPLFTPQGFIRDDVTFAQLAEFVWFGACRSGAPGLNREQIVLKQTPYALAV